MNVDPWRITANKNNCFDSSISIKPKAIKSRLLLYISTCVFAGISFCIFSFNQQSIAAPQGSTGAQKKFVPTHTVRMKYGRTYRGIVRPVKRNGKETSEILLTLEDGTQMRLKKLQHYLSYSKDSKELVEYFKKEKLVQPTAESHWKLATWCKSQKKLKAQYLKHSHKVIELDPNHEAARRACGFFRHADTGTWVKASDGYIRMGYVYEKNRWIIPSAGWLSQRISEEGEARKKEKRRITGLMKNIRRAKGEKKIRLINELLELNKPEMLDTVIKQFENKKIHPDMRAILRDLITRIESRDSLRYQMNLYLGGRISPQLGSSLIRKIKRGAENGDSEFAINHFISALNHGFRGAKEDPKNLDAVTARIDRAALALADLGSTRGITQLINATKIRYEVVISEKSSTGVGPGGVRGFDGGGDKTRKIPVIKQSKQSLATLKKITGQDFGYDQQRWYNWWVEKHDPGLVDLRRDQ